jgi:hypothetical protein
VAIFIFANDASSDLAAPIASTATTCTVSSGTGALFPNPSAGQQFAFTFNDAATGLLTEICYVTTRSGDVMSTMVRAQEGTVALNWLAGDLCANLVTAGQMAAMQQSAAVYPARIVTASGPFTMTTADVTGGVGLNRTTSVNVSSTTLPAGVAQGQIYAIEDLAANFNAYPVTVNAPAGMTIAGAANELLNVNRQCAYFRYYGSNIWSFKP